MGNTPTSIVSATPFEDMSIRKILGPAASMAAQTTSPTAATAPQQRSQVGDGSAMRILATSWLVSGSMRKTVPARPFATHSAPAPTARPATWVPTGSDTIVVRVSAAPTATAGSTYATAADSTTMARQRFDQLCARCMQTTPYGQ